MSKINDDLWEPGRSDSNWGCYGAPKKTSSKHVPYSGGIYNYGEKPKEEYLSSGGIHSEAKVRNVKEDLDLVLDGRS